VQLTARLTYSDGSTADVTASTAWSSTDANVIAVSSSGALLAVAQGQAEVVADAQGLSSRSTVRVASPASRLAAFAGYLVEASFIDGPGAAARFKSPRGIATDGMGNIYIADSENHTIRKINSDGIVSTLAGLGGVSGSSDGTGTDARFYYPQGVALDSLGNVYVAESGNSTIRKITAAGVVSTIAGKPGSNGFADGVGTEARFSGPQGIAADAFGNLYVADGDNNAIRKITPAGVVSTLAGRAGSPGSADGVGADARFDWPVGIATDSAGNVYVADIDNSNIRKINAAGIVSTLAGLAGVSGSDDGIGADARFYRPWGIATDRAGILYVAEDGNNTIRKITPAGLVSTLAGEAGLAGSDDGSGAEARFETPRGVAADNAGNLYVADSGNDKIRKITPAVTVSTLAGKGKSGESRKGSADGIGEAAQFNSPGAVATDSLGNLYVADSGNNIVRKISPSAIVSTLAGKAGEYGSADGVGEAARFSRLAGIATDSLGNLYVADIDNNTVRKITPSGIVSTLAGQAGSRGSADGAGPDARFDRPSGIAVDSAGNVYVGDTYNFKIRKISPAGVVSTVAGSGEPGNRDGDGALASFGACSYVSIGPPYPPALMCSGFGLATDEAGNVYVADSGNHTIRKITPTGTVSTLAGKAGSSGSADGVGPEARFNDPGALALDSAGNVYVADNGNCTVRKLGRTGAVQTIVGVVGRCGFIGGSLPGGLAPGGVAISGSSLYATTHDGVAVATDRP
jgi:sugar lactone lactonase YvrE